MRFVDTLPPLLVASLVTPIALMTMAMRHPTRVDTEFLTVTAFYWCLSLIAVGLFVVPVFATLPKLRQPPVWLAAVWGISTACVFVLIMSWPERAVFGFMLFGVLGGIGGIVYARLARRKRLRTLETN